MDASLGQDEQPSRPRFGRRAQQAVQDAEQQEQHAQQLGESLMPATAPIPAHAQEQASKAPRGANQWHVLADDEDYSTEDSMDGSRAIRKQMQAHGSTAMQQLEQPSLGGATNPLFAHSASEPSRNSSNVSGGSDVSSVRGPKAATTAMVTHPSTATTTQPPAPPPRMSHASSTASLGQQSARSSRASDKSRLELLRDQLLGLEPAEDQPEVSAQEHSLNQPQQQGLGHSQSMGGTSSLGGSGRQQLYSSRGSSYSGVLADPVSAPRSHRSSSVGTGLVRNAALSSNAGERSGMELQQSSGGGAPSASERRSTGSQHSSVPSASEHWGSGSHSPTAGTVPYYGVPAASIHAPVAQLSGADRPRNMDGQSSSRSNSQGSGVHVEGALEDPRSHTIGSSSGSSIGTGGEGGSSVKHPQDGALRLDWGGRPRRSSGVSSPLQQPSQEQLALVHGAEVSRSFDSTESDDSHAHPWPSRPAHMEGQNCEGAMAAEPEEDDSDGEGLDWRGDRRLGAFPMPGNHPAERSDEETDKDPGGYHGRHADGHEESEGGDGADSSSLGERVDRRLWHDVQAHGTRAAPAAAAASSFDDSYGEDFENGGVATAQPSRQASRAVAAAASARVSRQASAGASMESSRKRLDEALERGTQSNGNSAADSAGGSSRASTEAGSQDARAAVVGGGQRPSTTGSRQASMAAGEVVHGRVAPGPEHSSGSQGSGMEMVGSESSADWQEGALVAGLPVGGQLPAAAKDSDTELEGLAPPSHQHGQCSDGDGDEMEGDGIGGEYEREEEHHDGVEDSLPAAVGSGSAAGADAARHQSLASEGSGSGLGHGSRASAASAQQRSGAGPSAWQQSSGHHADSGEPEASDAGVGSDGDEHVPRGQAGSSAGGRGPQSSSGGSQGSVGVQGGYGQRWQGSSGRAHYEAPSNVVDHGQEDDPGLSPQAVSPTPRGVPAARHPVPRGANSISASTPLAAFVSAALTETTADAAGHVEWDAGSPVSGGLMGEVRAAMAEPELESMMSDEQSIPYKTQGGQRGTSKQDGVAPRSLQAAVFAPGEIEAGRILQPTGHGDPVTAAAGPEPDASEARNAAAMPLATLPPSATASSNVQQGPAITGSSDPSLARAVVGPSAPTANQRAPLTPVNTLVALPPEMMHQLYEVLQGAASGENPLSQDDLLLVSSLLWTMSRATSAQPNEGAAQTGLQGSEEQQSQEVTAGARVGEARGTRGRTAASATTRPGRQLPGGQQRQRQPRSQGSQQAPPQQRRISATRLPQQAAAPAQRPEQQAPVQRQGQDRSRRSTGGASVLSPGSEAGSVTSADVEEVAEQLKAKAVRYLERFKARDAAARGSILGSPPASGRDAPAPGRGMGLAGSTLSLPPTSARGTGRTGTSTAPLPSPGRGTLPGAPAQASPPAPSQGTGSAGASGGKAGRASGSGAGPSGSGVTRTGSARRSASGARSGTGTGAGSARGGATGGTLSAVSATLHPAQGSITEARAGAGMSPVAARSQGQAGVAETVAVALGGGSAEGAMQLALMDGGDDAGATWREALSLPAPTAETHLSAASTLQSALHSAGEVQVMGQAYMPALAQAYDQSALSVAPPERSASPPRSMGVGAQARAPSLQQLLRQMQLLDDSEGGSTQQQGSACMTATVDAVGRAAAAGRTSAASTGLHVETFSRHNEQGATAGDARSHTFEPEPSFQDQARALAVMNASGASTVVDQSNTHTPAHYASLLAGSSGMGGPFGPPPGTDIAPQPTVTTAGRQPADELALAATSEKQDVHVLLHHLERSGYVPSAAAAAVLSLPMAGLLPTQYQTPGLGAEEVARQLKAEGPVRREAGWVSSVQPAAVGQHGPRTGSSRGGGAEVFAGRLASSAGGAQAGERQSPPPVKVLDVRLDESQPATPTSPGEDQGQRHTTLTVHATPGRQHASSDEWPEDGELGSDVRGTYAAAAALVRSQHEGLMSPAMSTGFSVHDQAASPITRVGNGMAQGEASPSTPTVGAHEKTASPTHSGGYRRQRRGAAPPVRPAGSSLADRISGASAEAWEPAGVGPLVPPLGRPSLPTGRAPASELGPVASTSGRVPGAWKGGKGGLGSSSPERVTRSARASRDSVQTYLPTAIVASALPSSAWLPAHPPRAAWYDAAAFAAASFGGGGGAFFGGGSNTVFGVARGSRGGQTHRDARASIGSEARAAVGRSVSVGRAGSASKGGSASGSRGGAGRASMAERLNAKLLSPDAVAALHGAGGGGTYLHEWRAVQRQLSELGSGLLSPPPLQLAPSSPGRHQQRLKGLAQQVSPLRPAAGPGAQAQGHVATPRGQGHPGAQGLAGVQGQQGDPLPAQQGSVQGAHGAMEGRGGGYASTSQRARPASAGRAGRGARTEGIEGSRPASASRRRGRVAGAPAGTRSILEGGGGGGFGVQASAAAPVSPGRQRAMGRVGPIAAPGWVPAMGASAGGASSSSLAGRPEQDQPYPQHPMQVLPSAAQASPRMDGGRGSGAGRGAPLAMEGGTLATMAAMAGGVGMLGRPLGWQERDTRRWLQDLGLVVAAEEEEAPLLDNPYRNGVLLGDVALAVTGEPLPVAFSLVPRDMRAARRNLLLALEHLGLLTGLSMSDLQKLAAGKQPSAQQPAGYTQLHHDRALSSSVSLVWEVERVLQGQLDAIWGLLNYIRTHTPIRSFLQPRHSEPGAISPRPMSPSGPPGPGNASRRAPGSPGRQRDVSRGGRSAASVGGSGLGARAADLPPASAVWEAVSEVAFVAARAQAKLKKGGLEGWEQHTQPQGAVAHSRAAGSSGGASHAGGLAAAAGGVGLTTSGKATTKEQISKPFAAGMAAVSQSFAAASVHEPHSPMAASLRAVPPSSPPAHSPALPLSPRPLWRSPTLPYSDAQVTQLEQSLVRWLQQLGAIDAQTAVQGFSHLVPRLQDGTLLCWLVGKLTQQPVVGVNRRPHNEAAARANWLKAIDSLRAQSNMARRFLNYEEALLNGDRAGIMGLLEDLHRFGDGLPSAGMTLAPAGAPHGSSGANVQGPYLPFMQAGQAAGYGAGNAVFAGAGYSGSEQAAGLSVLVESPASAPLHQRQGRPRAASAGRARPAGATGNSAADTASTTPGRRKVIAILSPARLKAVAGGAVSPQRSPGRGRLLSPNSSTAELERYLAHQRAPYSPAQGVRPGSVLAALPHLRLVRAQAALGAAAAP